LTGFSDKAVPGDDRKKYRTPPVKNAATRRYNLIYLTDDELRRLTRRRLQDRQADPLEHYEIIAELRALGAEFAVRVEQLELSLPVAG
jgi:hypothetical protein